LPPALAAKARYDDSSHVLVMDELLTREEVKTLRDAVVTEDDRQAVEDYWERECPVGNAVKRLDEYARPVRVPGLTQAPCVRADIRDGVLKPDSHFSNGANVVARLPTIRQILATHPRKPGAEEVEGFPALIPRSTSRSGRSSAASRGAI
jgi:hypothetical protein